MRGQHHVAYFENSFRYYGEHCTYIHMYIHIKYTHIICNENLRSVENYGCE